MLAVVEGHPVQYHAPVYRAVEQDFGIPVTAIYGSDFSVVGYVDPEFGKQFSWDTDLLAGYDAKFLSRIKDGGARDDSELSTRGLGRRLAVLNPNVILLPGYNPAFYRQACRAAIKTRRPILFRGETTDHAVSRGSVKTAVRDFLLRSLYRRCSRLLFVGQRSRQHFERLGIPSAKLIFSPYCVDASVFKCDELARQKYRSGTRQNIGASPDDFVILFSGKLSHRKAPDLLINAVDSLPSELCLRVVLLFLGDGELRRSLELHCCPSISASQNFSVSEFRPRAHFAGFKNQRELSPYFHAADVLVLPSRFGETWGLVVNEALHHGIPAIVSEAVGCAPDLIDKRETGEVFATNSVTELAAAITRAVEWKDSATVRNACRAKVETYSVSRAAEGIARAYHEVVPS